MATSPLIEKIERYYSGRFSDHGPTARGVDWNGEISQELRFVQLLQIRDDSRPYALIDYGCGYGALAAYLSVDPLLAGYQGFDISLAMIEYAREQHGRTGWTFTDDAAQLEPADYAVASGIFNVKLDEGRDTWTEYAIETIGRLSALGRKGFAFNMLTAYSEPDRMRDDLYYGDPAFFFDLCKREQSPNVALLHDYGLWEFTILVRKELGR